MVSTQSDRKGGHSHTARCLRTSHRHLTNKHGMIIKGDLHAERYMRGREREGGREEWRENIVLLRVYTDLGDTDVSASLHVEETGLVLVLLDLCEPTLHASRKIPGAQRPNLNTAKWLRLTIV